MKEREGVKRSRTTLTRWPYLPFSRLGLVWSVGRGDPDQVRRIGVQWSVLPRYVNGMMSCCLQASEEYSLLAELSPGAGVRVWTLGNLHPDTSRRQVLLLTVRNLRRALHDQVSSQSPGQVPPDVPVSGLQSLPAIPGPSLRHGPPASGPPRGGRSDGVLCILLRPWCPESNEGHGGSASAL